MLKSMTGFGRADEIIEGKHIIIEIKSVNHKYFEFSSRITRGYNFLDDKLKTYIQSRVSRGKIDVYCHVENLTEGDVQVDVNHSLAAGYVNALREINETYGLNSQISVDSVSRFNDIFSVHKTPEDEDNTWRIVQTIAGKAVDSFISMRETEGEKLYRDIMNRAEYILSIVEKIESRSPETVTEYRVKLENKLREVLADRNIDDARILTEAAIFADKVAVDEETVRLRSHINQLRSFADSKEPIGRKMDFLIQEMNRETNTIGSKCSDSEIAYMVVDIKAEIEKIREQVQNIE
ncbi:MAG: YicC/YloC family endoribonuclease [Clostridia bacterium]|nr:YicC/YloC family endoribonuclease [Clostridia bacterium]